MIPEELDLCETIGRCALQALFQVCGGGFPEEEDRKKLRAVVLGSISFPNKNPCSSAGGKPQDVELRVALPLFHQWKRLAQGETVQVVSDLGLSRDIPSPKFFAELLTTPLEEACRNEGIAHYVRHQPSGVISIVTNRRSQVLRQAGKLPCPLCVKWCEGEKGLWWHQQQYHSIEHSDAAAVAASSMDTLAIIPYYPNVELRTLEGSHGNIHKAAPIETDDALQCIKTGHLEGLKLAVSKGYRPDQGIDARGASPLMWAAGSGNLEVVRYLVEECSCDPSKTQKGKRSFCGRTALHWAARNGHLPVVQYLVQESKVNIDASTIDGTTAFCWAAWQGHIAIMQFLQSQGCNIHTCNSFGCNAVLWCAQGKGDIRTMKWLEAMQCDLGKVNNNGHGVVHKAAQRGQDEICMWYVGAFVLEQTCAATKLKLIGPDTEGYCASDLAGVEGHETLARWLADREIEIARGLEAGASALPHWLVNPQADKVNHISAQERYTWERLGAARRMRWAVHSNRL